MKKMRIIFFQKFFTSIIKPNRISDQTKRFPEEKNLISMHMDQEGQRYLIVKF